MWEKILELKLKKLNQNDGKCEVCGKLVSLADCQLAHVVPSTKHNIKTYGKEVIHHPLNLKVVCSLRCNSRVLRNLATHPVEGKELIERIREELC